jgi:beta-D-xylosidase 4
MLREELGWDGHVVSDCTAIELMGDAKYDGCAPPYPPVDCKPDPFSGHNFTHGVVETASVAFTAGVDSNCGPFYRMWLGALAANGSVAQADVDLAVTRVYRTAVRLGLLDDPAEGRPYAQLDAAAVDSPAHRALALTAARESIVLIKNDAAVSAPILTLSGGGKGLKLAFIGPHANSTQAFLSNYHGDNRLVDSHSPLAAALARGLDVVYSRGCNICDSVPPGFPNMPCTTKSFDTSGIAPAAAAAAAADVAVLYLGSDQTTEAENFDRSAITLVGAQEQLLAAVLAANSNTVVVFVSGGVVSSPAAISGAPSILYSFYGGELAGEAIVDALTGVVSPAGKLPVTMYLPSIALRDIRDVDLASAGGITHLYFNQSVLRPFGWGLSYAQFSFEASFGATRVGALRVSRGALAAGPAGTLTTLRVRATSAAASTMASDCVVLVFLRPRAAAAATAAAAALPRQALVAFVRLRAIAPGDAREHEFELSARAMFGAFRGERGVLVPPRGTYGLSVGDVDAEETLEVEVE